MKLFFKLKHWLAGKVVCRFKGHDFGACIYLSPAVLTFCRRCGSEIQGRTVNDLEPMTDEDWAHIEYLEMMGEWDV